MNQCFSPVDSANTDESTGGNTSISQKGGDFKWKPTKTNLSARAAIQLHAHTGKRGDGRIFVIDVTHAIVIRSGEVQE